MTLKTVLDGVYVVIGTACLLSAQYHALHKLVFGHLEAYHMVELLTAALEQVCKGISLGEAVGENRRG